MPEWGTVPVPVGLQGTQDSGRVSADAEKWAQIEQSLEAVRVKGSQDVSFDGVYRLVVAVVEGGKGSWLYEKLVALTKASVLLVKERILNTDPTNMEQLTTVWEDLDGYLRKLRNITSYLECQWIQRNGLPSLLTTARESVVSDILDVTFVGTVLTDFVISRCSLDRNENENENCLVKRVLALLKDLSDDHYERLFNRKLLAAYKKQMEDFKETLVEPKKNFTETVLSVETMLNSLVSWMGDGMGLPAKGIDEIKLLAETTILGDEVIISHLLDTANELLATRSLHPLQVLVSHTTSLPSVPEQALCRIADFMKSDSVEKTLPLPQGVTPVEGMKIITNLHEYCTSLANLFPAKKDVDLINDAEKHVLHERESTVVSIMARFIDTTMKTADSDPQTAWNVVSPIYRILSQKDLFEEMCRKRLSARLLSQKECKLVEERVIVSCFKSEMTGSVSSAVRRMEEMLKDAVISSEETAAHRTVVPSEWVAFMVLNTAAWPSFNKIELSIPPVMWETLSCFSNNYSTRHTGRVLTWLHGLSHVTLLANFEKKHEISCCFVDGVVLMTCFGEGSDTTKSMKKISLELLTEASTDTCGAELKQSLNRLVATKLLSCSDKTPNDSSDFTLNTVFRQRKINVLKRGPGDTAARLVTSGPDAEATEHLLERKSLTEATLVRIMKTNKQMDYQELLTETIAQLSCRFRPDVGSIKKRLDDLLARGYLTRDDNNRNIFSYVS
eukprot:TRINITY_DN185_c5_g1_i1.p1 TRINITY_DN185_c5_g1~~TRINITY_DN185_c5_g1_i1.p1  ORF type:complete len:730 (+),score=173.28 TRINITY_DN185_c5_g1_i1:170-2359(+)